jgi:hypothetical protein
MEGRVNPLVRELLSAGGGKVVAIGGFLGPASEGRVRVYANLGLATYVELPEDEVVRVVDAETPSDPSTVYFRRDAEVTYVQTATMRAGEAIAAAAAAPPRGTAGCGCGGEAATAARQTGGGPIVDLCEWSCMERMRQCEVNSGTIGRLWCYLNYGACRLGCIDPPIIAT